MTEKKKIIDELKKDLDTYKGFCDSIDLFVKYIGLETPASDTLLSLYDNGIDSFRYKYGDEIRDWISYFIYECDFGRTPMEVTIDYTEEYLFSSIDTFIKFIEENEMED